LGHKANYLLTAFDVTKPTPFNGEHTAGPVAFISVPNAITNLGPLCTDPNKIRFLSAATLSRNLP
jgi:hypothetical protein